jgi:beta-glucanase (GH16 family)
MDRPLKRSIPRPFQRTAAVVLGVATLLAGSVSGARAEYRRPVLIASTAAPSGADETVAKPVSAPAPVARLVSALSPSGTAAPRGPLAGWHQVYAEDFGTPNPTGTFPSAGYQRHWGVYDDGWKDTSGNGTYMPSKVLSVHGGVLDYSVRTVGSQHLVAAPWLTDTKGHTYGRYSVRFRSDALPGYKTAWLLWPDSERWPADGEIDFPEGNLGRTGTIEAFAHHASAGGGQDAFSTRATFAAWHTVTVEWVPGKVRFLLDGKLIGTSTTMVPSTAMHWVLQTESNLDGYAPSAAVHGHVLVDWVAYWTRG